MRTGGDELLFLLPDTDADWGRTTVAQKIVENITATF